MRRKHLAHLASAQEETERNHNNKDGISGEGDSTYKHICLANSALLWGSGCSFSVSRTQFYVDSGFLSLSTALEWRWGRRTLSLWSNEIHTCSNRIRKGWKTCWGMKQTKQRGNLSASSVFIESFLSKWTEDVTTNKNDRSDIAIKGHRA